MASLLFKPDLLSVNTLEQLEATAEVADRDTHKRELVNRKKFQAENDRQRSTKLEDFDNNGRPDKPWLTDQLERIRNSIRLFASYTRISCLLTKAMQTMESLTSGIMDLFPVLNF